MSEIDEIEEAAALAEVETGARGASTLRLCRTDSGKLASRRWTDEENDYIRESHGRISEHVIAGHLGRSELSVHLHIERDLHLVAASKAPNILTAEQVSWGLGMGCGKSVHRLMDGGLMPHRKLPEKERGRSRTRIVDRQALLLWMLKPEHWVYFKPERVGTLRQQGARGVAENYDFAFWEDARELVLKARSAWKDEWLTPGQVALALGYKNARTGAHSLNTAIHRGTLKATRWGNWWILRSDLPASGMTINVFGKIVPKVKPKYACPRGMARHVNLSTCMKLRFCREAKAVEAAAPAHDHKINCSKNCSARK
ncbi:MAG: hypothetical protein PHS14_07660 [Elusimicrobia bacterium]|nr:hypothetical protein [Elusimicrobiota bacterium]